MHCSQMHRTNDCSHYFLHIVCQYLVSINFHEYILRFWSNHNEAENLPGSWSWDILSLHGFFRSWQRNVEYLTPHTAIIFLFTCWKKLISVCQSRMFHNQDPKRSSLWGRLLQNLEIYLKKRNRNQIETINVHNKKRKTILC